MTVRCNCIRCPPPRAWHSIGASVSRYESGFLRSSVPDHPAYRCRHVSSTTVRRTHCSTTALLPSRSPSAPTRQAGPHIRGPEGTLPPRKPQKHQVRTTAVTLSRASPATVGVECSRPSGQECTRLTNLGPCLVGIARDRDVFLVIFHSLLGFAGFFGGLGRAHIGAKTVRFLLQRRLKSGERFLRHAALQQHDPVQFARRFGYARSHLMLLALVLGVGGRTHRLERLVGLALGFQHKGRGDLRL